MKLKLLKTLKISLTDSLIKKLIKPLSNKPVDLCCRDNDGKCEN